MSELAHFFLEPGPLGISNAAFLFSLAMAYFVHNDARTPPCASCRLVGPGHLFGVDYLFPLVYVSLLPGPQTGLKEAPAFRAANDTINTEKRQRTAPCEGYGPF